MITSGFFNSIDGDRRYRAENFADYFNSIISTGVFEDTIGNLSVSPNSGMSVTIAPGKAFVNGYCMISNSAVSIAISAANSSLDRIDRIVVRLDLAGRNMDIVLLEGTPAGMPAPPELTRNTSRYEICLAEIYVAAGTTAITEAMITDTRSDETLCGGVYVRTADQLILAGKADKLYVDNTFAPAATVADIINGTVLTNASKLQGKTISTTAPTAEQILKFNGTQYIPANCGYVSGFFTGDGTASRLVNLGFTPSIVIMCQFGYSGVATSAEYMWGASGSSGICTGGIATLNNPLYHYLAKAIEIVTNGFNVAYTTGTYPINTNKSGSKYLYIAFR